MFGMSQKLLIISIILLPLNFLWCGEWQLINSIDKGPYGIHLKSPLNVYYYEKNKMVYVVDSGNNRLVSYSENGKPLKEFDAAGGLKLPVGMVKDNIGNLWIIERTNKPLIYINLHKKKINRYKLKYKDKEIFPDKIDIIDNEIVILDRNSGKIFIINKNLKVKCVIYPENKTFKGFFDIKVKKNFIWGMENLSGRLFGYDLSKHSFKIIKPDKKFIEPVSFDIDNNGNIYVLDRYLQKIFIFNGQGRLVNTQLQKGNRSGDIYYPWYVKIVKGLIFILDEGNGRVDIFKF